jgi:hypothetical protein
VARLPKSQSSRILSFPLAHETQPAKPFVLHIHFIAPRASEVTWVRITEACAARIASVAPLAEAASNLSARRRSALLVRLSLGGINPRVLPNHQGKGIIT